MRAGRRAAALLTLAAVAVGATACQQPAGAFFADARTDGVQVTDGWTPVVGDFDADGDDDLIWYDDDDGARVARTWWSDGQGGFAKAGPLGTIGGGYVPVVGDFGGDGADDVLWWGAGFPNFTEAQPLWVMRAGGGVAEVRQVALPVSPGMGVARPTLLDDTSSRDGIVVNDDFDALKVWDADRPDVGYTTALPYDGRWGRSPIPTTGDFDGDGSADVFTSSYGPAAVAFGDGAGGFVATPTPAVNGAYRQIVAAHVDADAAMDLVFVSRHRGPLPVWYGRTDRTFRTSGGEVPPFRTTGDLAVHRVAGSATDALVRYGSDLVQAVQRRPAGAWQEFTANPVALGRSPLTTPLVGQFRAGGREDVLVYQPASSPDTGSGTEHLLLG